MKRTSVVLLVISILCCLTACGSVQDAAPTTTSITLTTTTTQPITTETDAAGVLHQNAHLKGKKATDFELPLTGATGFASYPIGLYKTAALEGATLRTLQPGDAFTVLEESATAWRVRCEDGTEGWLENITCYLNIPDVIPSVVIEHTNSTASVFVSSGVEIPQITGEKLYNASYYNERFGGMRTIMAANYNMVKKIYCAQTAALQDGYTLVINETFRPFDVQLKISDQLAALRLQNETVRQGIDKQPWGIGWFISSRLSTHQMGCAMDVSLAKVTEITWNVTGEYLYPTVTAYRPCEMPTPIHELSAAAVSLASPVNSYSATAWKTIQPAKSMTDDALRLKQYCVDAGMSPLASEWWHFNDLDTKTRINNRCVSDVFYLDACVSKIPD